MLCLKLARIHVVTGTLLAVTVAGVISRAGAAAATDPLYRSFVNPPDNARIMMRWWWFGPSVVKPEIERELRVMKAADIGGVEIQPVYPVELDDPQKHFRNFPYLSGEFLDDIGFTARTAKEMGMRVDVTLGSGWPYGGPDTPVTEAAGRLRIQREAVAESEHSMPVPAMENGEKLIAAFLASGDGRSFTDGGAQRLTDIQNGRLQLPADLSGAHTVLFFIASRTGQQVKRPGIGAEGFVLDHYESAAIEHHLTAVGDRLLQAFGPNPPHAVFSDSLEVFASDWTSDFLTEFQKRRGYDLLPYLPALAGDIGDQDERDPARLGQDVDRIGRGALPHADSGMGACSSHSFPLPDLWRASGDPVEQRAGRPTGRRARTGMAGLQRGSMGVVRKSPVRAADHLDGNLDLAALASISRHSARHESGSGLALH